MTEQIYSENIRKIMQNKKQLEKELNIKIKKEKNIILVEGKPEDEFLALQAIEAINLGFSVPKALLLKEEDITFKKINIKDLTKRKDLERDEKAHAHAGTA